jgi:putative flippase GtrA
VNLRALFFRWAKFNTVGAVGIGVQLVVLVILRSLVGLNYLVATGLAVEAAVLHNFLWHERWTWVDRTTSGRGVLRRLLSFNLTTGLVSLIINLGLMRLLVGRFHIQYLIANLFCVAAGSLANFALSDWFVFARVSEKERKSPLLE